MTESTPAPAEQAVGQGNSSLSGEAVAPEYFIPPATRNNYAQIARDQAAIRGVEPRQIMGELADQFEQLHGRQPLDGYDHLAAWARDFDPGVGAGPTGLAVLQARALESARRDPYQSVTGDQALVEQAVATQHAADESAAGAAGAPSVDPASGALPNAGPLPIPADVTVGPEGAQVAQGDPSPGVVTAEGQPDAPSTTTGSAPPPEPSPADTTTSTTGGGGKGHGKSSGGSS
jgi:hypothetical protein